MRWSVHSSDRKTCPRAKAVENSSNTKVHASWRRLIAVSLSLVKNTGRNDLIVRAFFMWANMFELSTPGSTDRSRTDLCDDWSMEVVTAAHVTFRDTGRPFREESFMFPYQNACYFSVCGEMASQIADETVSSPESQIHMYSFHAPKHSLPNASQWKYSSGPPLSKSHNTTNKEKMLPWILVRRGFAVCSLTPVCQAIQIHAESQNADIMA